jgi:hypothetical protein
VTASDFEYPFVIQLGPAATANPKLRIRLLQLHVEVGDSVLEALYTAPHVIAVSVPVL